MLKVKEQVVHDGKRVFVYEQPGTGDLFTITDPNLRLDQLEEVQRDVAALLERGLNPPPEAVPATVVGGRNAGGDGCVTCDTRAAAHRTTRIVNPRLPVSEFAALQTRLGYAFHDESLLRLALTHPSVAHEQGVPVQHNQRLEFLGDAVLQLVLTRELYEKFPRLRRRPAYQSPRQTGEPPHAGGAWAALGLGAHLILSRGEEMHGGRERPSALADTFEALLGAIFMDGGYDAASDFILREFQAAFGELTVLRSWKTQRASCRNCSRRDPPRPANTASFPPADRTTTASSNAPSITTALNSRAVRAKAKKPPKAKPRSPRSKSCGGKRPGPATQN